MIITASSCYQPGSRCTNRIVISSQHRTWSSISSHNGRCNQGSRAQSQRRFYSYEDETACPSRASPACISIFVLCFLQIPAAHPLGGAGPATGHPMDPGADRPYVTLLARAFCMKVFGEFPVSESKRSRIGLVPTVVQMFVRSPNERDFLPPCAILQHRTVGSNDTLHGA